MTDKWLGGWAAWGQQALPFHSVSQTQHEEFIFLSRYFGAVLCGLNVPFSVFQIQMLETPPPPFGVLVWSHAPMTCMTGKKMLSACVADIYIFFCLPQMAADYLSLLQSKSRLRDRKHFKICFLSQSCQSVGPFKTSLQTDDHLAVSSALRPVNRWSEMRLLWRWHVLLSDVLIRKWNVSQETIVHTVISERCVLTLFWKKDAWKCAVVADIDIKLICSELGLCK